MADKIEKGEAPMADHQSDMGPTPADLIHENDVYAKFPGLFADRELREAYA